MKIEAHCEKIVIIPRIVWRDTARNVLEFLFKEFSRAMHESGIMQ